jgi:hypothetical protein
MSRTAGNLVFKKSDVREGVATVQMVASVNTLCHFKVRGEHISCVTYPERVSSPWTIRKVFFVPSGGNKLLRKKVCEMDYPLQIGTDVYTVYLEIDQFNRKVQSESEPVKKPSSKKKRKTAKIS